MRLRIAALATALLVSIVSATFAQTGIGVLDVWLKARESADAPNDQKVMLYKKSKALVIGMDHYSSGWPQLSNGIKDSVEVAKALTAQGVPGAAHWRNPADPIPQSHAATALEARLRRRKPSRRRSNSATS